MTSKIPSVRRFVPWSLFVLAAAGMVAVTFGRHVFSAPAPRAGGAVIEVPTSVPVAFQDTTSSVSRPRQLPDLETRDRRRQAALERSKVAARQRMLAFAGQFGSEIVDSAWAGAAEGHFGALGKSGQIAQVQAVPRNLSVVCKTTVCRFEADFPTQIAAQDWLTLFASSLGNAMPSIAFETTSQPDGSQHITVYGIADRQAKM